MCKYTRVIKVQLDFRIAHSTLHGITSQQHHGEDEECRDVLLRVTKFVYVHRIYRRQKMWYLYVNSWCFGLLWPRIGLSQMDTPHVSIGNCCAQLKFQLVHQRAKLERIRMETLGHCFFDEQSIKL